METTKTSNFTGQSKSFTGIFFTSQVSACGLQPFSCHDLANDIHSQTTKVRVRTRTIIPQTFDFKIRLQACEVKGPVGHESNTDLVLFSMNHWFFPKSVF